MNKQYAEDFKKGKLVVHCDNTDEAKRFIKWCHENNMGSISDTFPVTGTRCYRYDETLLCGKYSYYKKEGYTIVSFKEMFNNTFTKVDLMTGHMIQCRDGRLFHVFPTEKCICFVTKDCGWFSIGEIDDDLTSPKNHGLDIMKVYGFPIYACISFDFDTDNRNLLWQRDEPKEMTVDQVSEILGYEVKIIGGDK